MDGINPQTGKRLGKFLWMDSDSAQDDYLRQLKSKIASGYYSSDMVISSIIEDIAPSISNSINVEVAG